MPSIFELHLKRHELSDVLYPKLRHSVFHYSFGQRYQEIMRCGYVAFSFVVDVASTAIYTEKSAGKHLKAVCLFDLRGKTDEEIAPGKSYYDFLNPHPKIKQAVYFVVSDMFYEDITIFSALDDYTKANTMYLPTIESWHIGHLPLNKLECIYVVNIKD